ncbi:MAG TPA: RDD family protein, partial [Myxococcaceae bacterium]|nr:RDD family protein [Myxococcaceae bacterium]
GAPQGAVSHPSADGAQPPAATGTSDVPRQPPAADPLGRAQRTAFAASTDPRRTQGRGRSSEIEEIHARPAALWRRLIATVIDTGILGGIVAGYLALASRIVGARAEPSAMTGLDALAHQLHAWGPILLPGAVLAVVLGAVYAAAFALVWGGRTPGRLIVGIRLVDASGYPPGPWRAVFRAILSLFSFALLLAGFWLALFDRRGQTLHDKLTRTFVVQPS